MLQYVPVTMAAIAAQIRLAHNVVRNQQPVTTAAVYQHLYPLNPLSITGHVNGTELVMRALLAEEGMIDVAASVAESSQDCQVFRRAGVGGTHMYH